MGDNAGLKVENLSRSFGDVAAVSDVSFQLDAGRVLCLLGHSGCGKSTTLRIVAGVEPADTGTISLNGNFLEGPGISVPPEARSVGLIFQDFALFPHLTVRENVAFGIRKRGDPKRVAELLERVKLSDLAHRYPHELSGGEQQRVSLARALAPGPEVMLMDEPFSSLDERLRDEVRDATLDILKENNTSVLLVTHEPAEAMRMGDEIALMRRGKIVQHGTPYTIYNNPIDYEAARFFSDVNVIEGRVEGALCSTPFGEFLVPGIADGTAVQIVIRPQHIGVDFDRGGSGPNPSERGGIPARGVVHRARFLGRESQVEFKMDHDGSILKAFVPSVFLPAEGRPLWLTIRRDHCYVFPKA